MTKKVVVEVEKLVKQYKDVLAVDEVSFDVYQGEIFSLVGPNGAGKTSTVEILECLRNPTTGSAKVLGLNVVEDEAKIKKRIGAMPQDFNTFERLTVKENVELIAQIYGVKGKTKEALETLGLWQIKNRKFHTLSGGMKRRVGFCMALVSDPELLFLDEPTTGLDPQARKDSWDVIRNLKEMGKTVFLTSHYMEEVERLSDRAAVIANGKIEAMDSIRSLISAYGGDIKVLVKGNRKKGARDTLGRLTDNVSFDEEDNLIGKFETRAEASKALVSLYQLDEEYITEIIEPGMDDVFFNLVGSKVDERGELI